MIKCPNCYSEIDTLVLLERAQCTFCGIGAGEILDTLVARIEELEAALDENLPWAEVGIAESYKQGGIPDDHYEIALDRLDDAQKLLY